MTTNERAARFIIVTSLLSACAQLPPATVATREHDRRNAFVAAPIRAPGHCDFTVAEQAAAFASLVKWVETGVKPAGDEVLTASVVAQLNYGCAHTDDAVAVDDSATVKTWRSTGKLPACRAK